MKFQIDSGKLIGCELGNEEVTNGYELTIPDGVTSIECFIPQGVTILNIPASVDNIISTALDFCDTIKTINSAGGCSATCIDCCIICDGRLIAYYGNNENVKIPDSVYFICGEAFIECKKLESITVPGSVIEISHRAFLGCKSLKNITIFNGTEYIGEDAFKDCVELETISIPESVIEIGANAFSNTKWLNNYSGDFVIINGILAAYKGKKSIHGFILPKNVSDISLGVFESCNQLTTVNINGFDYSCNNMNFSIDELIWFVLHEEYDEYDGDHLDVPDIIISDKHNIILQMVCAGVESAVKYVKDHFDTFYDYAVQNNNEQILRLFDNWQNASYDFSIQWNDNELNDYVDNMQNQ